MELGTVVTLLLGALITLAIQGLMLFVNDRIGRQKEDREAQRALEKEEREAARARASDLAAAASLRHDEAASVIFKSFLELERVAQDSASPESAKAVRSCLSEIGVHAAYLPAEWRDLITPLTEIVSNARWISQENYHPDSHWAIVRNSCRFGREVCADLLARRARPDPPRRIRMYIASLADPNSDQADQHIDDVAEMEAEEAAWLRRHPDFE